MGGRTSEGEQSEVQPVRERQELRGTQRDASMGFCSAVTLAFATIFSLVAAALLAIAFSTDNWVTIKVDREELKTQLLQAGKISADDFNQSPLYFTRTRGLFRECYLGEKLEEDPDNNKVPIREDIYISPVETWCRNIDYFIPDENDQTKTFNKEEMTRVHMMRAMIALFIVGFFFMFVSFTAGIRGCWKTSPSNITASDTELFTQSWPQVLKEHTEFKYEWSYIVSWIGVGLALISSILFSLAAVCIRTDKEREDAMNMQYLMPVYHQKQAQQPYGPYGYAAYPGPYYGSQYGPYNY